MTQDIVDFHCKTIRESIKSGDSSIISYLNYLKNYASSINTRKDWLWIGHCLVMNGYLTVDDNNDFQVK